MVVSPDLPAPFTAGTQLKLSCTFDVSSDIDADDAVSISTLWLKNGIPLSSLGDNRIELTEMFSAKSHTYSTFITISPVSLTLDSVDVSCAVGLTTSLRHVRSSTTTTNYQLLITSEPVFV